MLSHWHEKNIQFLQTLFFLFVIIPTRLIRQTRSGEAHRQTSVMIFYSSLYDLLWLHFLSKENKKK